MTLNNRAESFIKLKQLIMLFALLTASTASLAQTGAAGGAAAENVNPDLEYCAESLGTLAVFEDTAHSWWNDYYRRYPSLGRSGGGSLGGYTSTPEGKVIASAFADSYNQMVRALRNYETQTVEGGLGTGGKIGIGD